MYAPENNLHNEQAEFCPNRSCIDQINTLRIITEQSVEFQSSMYMVEQGMYLERTEGKRTPQRVS
jgi:hypothetical protein